MEPYATLRKIRRSPFRPAITREGNRNRRRILDCADPHTKAWHGEEMNLTGQAKSAERTVFRRSNWSLGETSRTITARLPCIVLEVRGPLGGEMIPTGHESIRFCFNVVSTLIRNRFTTGSGVIVAAY